jgi:hypothetical protein
LAGFASFCEARQRARRVAAVDALAFGGFADTWSANSPRLLKHWLGCAKAIGLRRLARSRRMARVWKTRLRTGSSELLDVAALADAVSSLQSLSRYRAKFPLLTERARASAISGRWPLLAAPSSPAEIKDNASPELRRLRSGINSTRDNIHPRCNASFVHAASRRRPITSRSETTAT